MNTFRQRRASAPASLTYENGELVYKTPYDPTLVQALKDTIPSTERRWDSPTRSWIVVATEQNARALVNLTNQHLGENIAAPMIPVRVAKPETRILEVRYIGITKERGDGERSAFGWINGNWDVVFPEPVLRSWFGADPQRPDESPTLYAILGIKSTANDSEVKPAYRRLALQWHPDRCSEPDAKEVFIKIQHAYEVLSNPQQRARYDAGLALEAGLQRNQRPKPEQLSLDGYRSPLRCGLLMCTGVETLGRFIVSEIHVWNDITNAQDQVLVTSWPMGAKTFTEGWV